MAQRPETPSHIRLQLRQEANFGCCRCGFAIVQYHHIIPYAIRPDFRVEDMMALCTRCHDAVRGGALTEAEQRKMKAVPYNRVHKRAKGTIYLKQDYIPLDIGDGVFLVGDALNLHIGGKRVLGLRRTDLDTLSISMEVTSADGKPVLTLQDNDWMSADELPWDLEVDWGKIRIRQAPRHVLLEFDATKIPMRLRGTWHWAGQKVSFENHSTIIGHQRLSNLGLVGFNFELSNGGMKFGPPDGRSGCIVSEPDPQQRLYKCRKANYEARATTA
jgi:hypothetical protein